MRYRLELKNLANEIEQILSSKSFRSHEEAEFFAKKNEILNILRILYGEASREFRVVKLSALPVTTLKVVNHVLSRTINDICYAGASATNY